MSSRACLKLEDGELDEGESIQLTVEGSGQARQGIPVDDRQPSALASCRHQIPYPSLPYFFPSQGSTVSNIQQFDSYHDNCESCYSKLHRGSGWAVGVLELEFHLQSMSVRVTVSSCQAVDIEDRAHILDHLASRASPPGYVSHRASAFSYNTCSPGLTDGRTESCFSTPVRPARRHAVDMSTKTPFKQPIEDRLLAMNACWYEEA